MSNWIPESGSPLSSPAINVMAAEASSMKLWQEFLSGYFDGNLHLIRGAYIKVPKAQNITFQEDMPVKGGDDYDGIYIHVTKEKASSSSEKRLFPNGIWMVTEHARLTFWLRARIKSPKDGENSRSMVRTASDLLFAILKSNLLTAPLTRRGMTSFCPNPPTLFGASSMPMRQLNLRVTYTYSLQEATI